DPPRLCSRRVDLVLQPHSGELTAAVTTGSGSRGTSAQPAEDTASVPESVPSTSMSPAVPRDHRLSDDLSADPNRRLPALLLQLQLAERSRGIPPVRDQPSRPAGRVDAQGDRLSHQL